MASSSSPSPNAALLALFPITSVGTAYFLWRHIIGSGVYDQLKNAAKIPISLTGIGFLDRYLTMQSTLIGAQGAFSPSTPNFMPGMLSSLASSTVVPYVESTRLRIPGFARFPSLLGALGQMVGAGVVQPLYWFGFLQTGAARPNPVDSRGSSIRQVDAEATLLAALAGYVLPALGMSLTSGTKLPWVLSFYLHPVIMGLTRYAWITLRKGDKAPNDPEKAYKLTMATYAVTMIYATVLHLIVLVPKATHFDQLKALLGVNIHTPDPKSATIASGAFDFLHWDAVGIFVPAVLATIGFARSKQELAKILAWDLFGVIAGGTGMAISGVWMWRERRLRKERKDLFAKDE